MKLIQYLIKNPVVIYAITLVIVVFGCFSLFHLPVSALPSFKTTQVMIATNYSGATPSFMAQAVSTPIEEAIQGIAGIDTVRSFSSTGVSHVHITFKPGADIQKIENEIRNQMSLVRDKLPKAASAPNLEISNNSSANIVMYVGVSSKSQSLLYLSQYVRNHLIHQLQQIPGVGQVTMYGGQEPAVRIYLNPNKMASYGLSTLEVLNILNRENVNSSGGTLITKQNAYMLSISSKPDSLAALRKLTVKHLKKNNVVTLGEIATVKIAPANGHNSAYIDGHPGVSIAITPQLHANNIAVAGRVNELLDSLQSQIPADIHVKPLYSSVVFIKHSVGEVYKAIAFAVLLVSLTVIFFLRIFRLAFVPIIVIPICLFSGFIFMELFNFSINLMTLLALILAVGLVVDDAIVVVENAVRHFARTGKAQLAIVDSSREISMAIISMTGTIVVVYLPLMFLQGFVGELIKPFAYILASVIVVSGLLSLSLSPTMISQIFTRWNKDKPIEPKHGLVEKLIAYYKAKLEFAMRYRYWLVLLCAVVLLLGIWIISTLPSVLLPAENYGDTQIGMQLPNNTSPSYYREKLKEIGKAVLSTPYADSYFAVSDFSQRGASIEIDLRRHLDAPIADVQQQIESLLQQKILGARISVGGGQLLPVSNSSSVIEFELLYPGCYQKLNKIKNNFVKELKKYPGFFAIDSDLSFSSLMFKMHILNESARDLGVPPAAISQTMSALYGGMQANNKFDTGGQAIPIILSLPSKDVANLSLLPLLKVKSSTTQNLIPLSELVRAKLQAGSQALSHFDGQRSTRVDILLKHGFEIEPAMKYIKKMAAIYLPKNMQLVWSGPSRSFLEANSNMLVMILLALLFIYLVLVMQFKSFVDPFIVLLIIPLAFTGAAIALKLTGGSMNIYTKVSLLTLIGLITKHGILIVDFARYHEQQGKTPVQAAIAAATLRAKPVLMTTLAMILGSLPLVFLSGEGTVALNQMGWTIVGGLLLGSFLSLFAVPVVFVIFRALRLTRLKS